MSPTRPGKRHSLAQTQAMVSPSEEEQHHHHHNYKKMKKKRQKTEDNSMEIEVQPKPNSSESLSASVEEASDSLSALNLLRLIKNRDIAHERKVEQAYVFITNGSTILSTNRESVHSVESGLVPRYHFVTSLSEWVQGLIISSSKSYPTNSIVEDKGKSFDESILERTVATYLDIRCWAILKWCLASGIPWNVGFVSLGILQSLSRLLDEAYTLMSQDALFYSRGNNIKKTDRDNRRRYFTEDFFAAVHDVAHLLFCRYEGLFRPKLDLWVPSTISCLRIASVFCSSTYIENNGNILFDLIILILRRFVSFLRSSPNPRKVFQSVVDKLLESLLSLLGKFRLAGFDDEKQKISGVVKDILKYSLFHRSHLEGYQNVCKLLKQSGSRHDDIIPKDEPSTNSSKETFTFLSYQKLLFQKLDYFVKEGKACTLKSIAWIFRTYIQEVKTQMVLKSSNLLGSRNKQPSRSAASKNSLGLADQLPDQDTESGIDHHETKKDSERIIFFAVFTEFISPLLEEFEASSHVCFLKNELTVENLTIVKSLLNSTNNLLLVAKEEQIYVPTEDTPDLTNLDFIKKIYSILTHFNMALQKSYAQITSGNMSIIGNEEIQVLLMEVLNGTFIGINHILELEYRVLENDLEKIWMTVFFMAAFQFTLGSASAELVSATERAVNLASRILTIFSELRQIDRAILSLCDFLRYIAQLENPLSYQVKPSRKALEAILLSKHFLMVLSSVIQEIPEGQVASFMRLLGEDMEQTLKMIQPSIVHPTDRHKRLQQTSIKVITEIYVCILDQGNVTASNSVQFGASLRTLMDRSLIPCLGDLVDSALSDEDMIGKYTRFTHAQSENSGSPKEDLQHVWPTNKHDDSSTTLSLTWAFVLRLYMSVKCLHRRCVTLMPPKAARKASISVNDTTLVLYTGELTKVEDLITNECFFSCVRKGDISVLDVLSSIRTWIEATKQKKVEPLEYTLFCIGVQSLADLKRQIKAVHYTLVEADLGTLDSSCKINKENLATNQSNLSHKKSLRKFHKKLKKKAMAIASFLLRWIKDLLEKENRFQTKRKSSGQVDSWCTPEITWNKVVANLSSQTLPVARWGLLCQNLGVWSEFADSDDLKLFTHFMLGLTISLDNHINDDKERCNVFSITKDLLNTDSFYEEKVVREVFLQELCQQLEDNLCLSKLKLPIESAINYIQTQLGTRNTYSNFNRSRAICSEAHEVFEDYSLSFTNIDFVKLSKCVQLMNLVSKFPNGYIETESVPTFISFIFRLERCIVLLILNSRNHCLERCNITKASQLLCGLDLLISCRRCLESLLLKDTVLHAAHGDSSIMSIVLNESFSMYWFTLSMRAIACCMHALNPAEDVLLKEALLSLARCTRGLFSFCCENLFREYLKPLLMRQPNDTISAIATSTFKFNLGSLFSSLVTESIYFSELIRSRGLSSSPDRNVRQELNRKENSVRKEYPYGLVTFLVAISSVLWNVTKTMESFDEKCHLDKSGSTKWSDLFPHELSSFIYTIESFLSQCIQEILLADEGIAIQSENFKTHKYLEHDNVSHVENAVAGSEGELQGDENHFIDVANIGDLAGQEDGAAEIKNYHDVLSEDSEIGSSSEEDMHLHKEHHKRASGEITSISKHSVSDVTEELMDPAGQRFADFPEISDAQLSMFQEMLSGKMIILSDLLGEIFIAMAAILRLKSLSHSPNKINCEAGFAKHLSNNMICLHGGFASKILQAAAIMSQTHDIRQLILLLGATKYLESIGSFLPYAKPTYSPSAIVSLMSVQMSLYGSIVSKIQVKNVGQFYQDLRTSLQNCFIMFLKRPLGLHFHLTLQTIERALLGSNEVPRHETIRGSCFSNSIQNLMLIAGIEYLSISLNAVTGVKRLQILARYSSRYLAAIFNLFANDQILWYGLAGSSFYLKIHGSSEVENVDLLDSRSVAISKCIEILATIASREVIFPMKSYHVAQAMTVPSVLFRPFYQRNAHQLKSMQNISTSMDVWDVKDCKFLIPDDSPALNVLLEVYMSSCKLLCNLLKHRKRESGHCIALLGDSLRTMLFFLEILDLSSSLIHNGSRHIVECAIQCASGLRRVYEEIAEHKDTVGAYYAHLLSDYICVISGYGMTVTGLSRKIEVIIRSGAYALVDSCSPDDLQQLHAVLGEGPRRTALSELRRDYEQHFKYTGKV